MVSSAQEIRTGGDAVGGGPPITIPAFAAGRGAVHHFFGTRARRGSGSEGLSRDGLPSGGAARGPAAAAGSVTAVSVKQVHGTDVLVLDRPVRPGEPIAGGWDALVTDQPDVLLIVRTADCVPVLLYDPERHVAAAVHAGWRGAVAGILQNTIETMRRRFGSAPAALEVGIGPSVGPCCYEVDRPVLTRLRAHCPDWRQVSAHIGPDRARLDLRALLRRQAEREGVQAEAIRTVRLCTACHPGLFYSYRRDGGVKGTMASGIVLKVP